MAVRIVFIPNLGTPLNQFRRRSIGARFRACATIQQAPQGVEVEDSKLDIVRRSANWLLDIWDYKLLGSLGTEYGEERFVHQINELKEEVKGMINDRHMRASDKSEFIDAVQRLGLGYHFETEIKDALGLIQELHLNGGGSEFNDLYTTALLFRLFRQHGFHIQREVFEILLKNDDFEGMLKEDVVKGMLSLYEASFYGIKGDTIMDEAKVVALKSLDSDKVKYFPDNLARKVERALDITIDRPICVVFEAQPNCLTNLLLDKPSGTKCRSVGP